MGQRTVVKGAFARAGAARRSNHERAARCGSILLFSLASALLPWKAITAQVSPPDVRLTVRPHEIATAAQTKQAGWQTLEGKPAPSPGESMCGSFFGGGPPKDPAAQRRSREQCYDILEDSLVYVPQQCVGARRCPLLVWSNAPREYYSQVADKYGMVVAHLVSAEDLSNPRNLDRELEGMLRTFAVDPDKIAILGRCASGPQTVEYGSQNLDVFSRIMVGTLHTTTPPANTSHRKNEYLIAGGLLENEVNFWGVWGMRDRGYPVTHSVQFRAHTHTYEEYDFWGRWLQESWTPGTRRAPYAFSEPPILTTDVLTKLTEFWTVFQEEPDSVWTTARRAAIREVLVPVGKEQISTLMTDMAALSAKYPSVAAALRAAQLTPQDHDRYRAALVSAVAYKKAFIGVPADQIDSVASRLGVTPTSAVKKNTEFMDTHPDEWEALVQTGMWETP